MTKKGFTIKLDEELWKEFSIKCIKKGKTKADILEEMVKEFIKKA
ncbi:MAG TPA: ribbon-helix-helix domain-containing protein [archaeon]|nr:ribbon-helix-helix domain-containing protein [archaeon]